MPLLLASDSGVVLQYETASGGDDKLAILKFVRPRAHFFGPANDDALSGHPRRTADCKPYGVFEVIESHGSAPFSE